VPALPRLFCLACGVLTLFFVPSLMARQTCPPPAIPRCWARSRICPLPYGGGRFIDSGALSPCAGVLQS
jgi:hypothetical protein